MFIVLLIAINCSKDSIVPFIKSEPFKGTYGWNKVVEKTNVEEAN